MAGDPRPDDDTKPAQATLASGPGSAAGGTPSLPDGIMFGRYRIGRVIAKGGMGTIYEATLRDLNKKVALKMLSPGMLSSPEAVARFYREGETAAKVRHPHVVDITDVGVQDSTPYLVMEFMEGEDMATFLERTGPMPVEEMVDTLLPVCAAVWAAHQEGIVHRDLKPHNIFLARSRDGHVTPKLLDFGISKVATASGITRTESMLGTPAYMSPEQVKGAKNIDARSDQYAMGVILYEAATGQLPFLRSEPYAILHAIVNDPFDPPRAHRPDLPEGLEAMIMRAMSRAREGRFDSMADLGAALLPFASPTARARWEAVFHGKVPLPVSSRSAGEPSRPSQSLVLAETQAAASVSQTGRTARPTPVVAIAAVAALVLSSAGAFLALSRGASRPAASASAAPAALPSIHLEITVDPDDAALELDGEPVGNGRLARDVPATGSDHLLAITRPGFVPKVVKFGHGVPPPSRVVLEPVVAPSPEPTHESAAETEAEAEPTAAAKAAAPEPAAAKAAPPPASKPAAPSRKRKAGTNGAPILGD